MARVAPNVPSETDLLCETCGYTLNGLPPEANCPECGTPIQSSVLPIVRKPSAWESERGLVSTTAEIIFHPSRFFRQTTSRGDPTAKGFGVVHTAIASALFAAAATIHEDWYFTFVIGNPQSILIAAGLWLGLTVCTFVAMTLLTRLAVRLTNWEATYRGIRLPPPVVQRSLAFHAAHYLPLGIVAVVTTTAYQLELNRHPIYWSIHVVYYLAALSAEVVLGAMYLFNTYWLAMRKIMYANY